MNLTPQPKKDRTTLQVILAFLAGGIVQISLTFLVICGIVVWQYQRFDQDMDISVPAAETQDNKERQVGEIIVSIRANGDIVVDSQVLTTETLIERLHNIAKADPDQAVILRGHEDAHFQHVIGVLNTIKDAGIWNVAFATTKP